MQKKKYMTIFLCVLLCVGAGCKKKEDTHPGIDKTHVETETKSNVQNSEDRHKKTDDSVTKPSKIPTPPRNQKEYDEMFGVVDESGTWIPPEGAYKDPKSGNIKNKDGVVISSGNQMPRAAQPGSKG